jgi:hypothetical protein
MRTHTCDKCRVHFFTNDPSRYLCDDCMPADFKFYPEPFGESAPPPAPPNREYNVGLSGWLGRRETKDSKRRTAEWEYRITEYRARLSPPRGSMVTKPQAQAIQVHNLVANLQLIQTFLQDSGSSCTTCNTVLSMIHTALKNSR